MKEKEVELSFKKVKIWEVKFLEMSDIDDTSKKTLTKGTLKLCTDLTEDEIENLSASDGMKLMKEVNMLNGFGTANFQQA